MPRKPKGQKKGKQQKREPPPKDKEPTSWAPSTNHTKWKANYPAGDKASEARGRQEKHNLGNEMETEVNPKEDKGIAGLGT